MILTDREIQLSLHHGQFTIDPCPELECYSSTSVDLRLKETLTIFHDDINTNAIETVIDPTKRYSAEQVIRKFSDEKTIGDEGYVLHPGIFVLGWTYERVDLPIHSRIAARVEGKSSLARLGLLVHFTAPTIHSGFNNLIRLEILNLGRIPIRLHKKMRICQLIFEITLGTPDKAFVPRQTA